MISKSINQAIRDSVNSTTVNLEHLAFFANELSRITLFSFWSTEALNKIHNVLYDKENGVFEDVADYLIEFNTHLVYNMTSEQYMSLVMDANGGLQALTREVLTHSSKVIPVQVTSMTVGNVFQVTENEVDKMSTLIFILRLHVTTLYQAITNKLNKG